MCLNVVFDFGNSVHAQVRRPLRVDSESDRGNGPYHALISGEVRRILKYVVDTTSAKHCKQIIKYVVVWRLSGSTGVAGINNHRSNNRNIIQEHTKLR